MTNLEIIERAKIELAKEGKIKYTGKVIKFVFDGMEIEIKETEQIHTFAYWKEKGYKVKKGEHCVTRIQIWKYSGKLEELPNGEEIETGKMFMKIACFFSESQVEKIK